MECLRHVYYGVPKKAAPLSKEFLDRLEQVHLETEELDQSVSKYSYLIVGGNGFLGGYVCRELMMRHAAHVRVLSRSMPAEDRRIDNVEYFQGSITSLQDLKKALEGIDIVFHLAASIGSPAFGYRNKASKKPVFEINKGGAEKLVQAAQENGNIKFIAYMSSVDVVFTPQGFLKSSEDQLDYRTEIQGRAASHYQASKVEAEKIILGADDPNGFRTVALRPGGIYGPQEEYALPKVISAGWYTGRNLFHFGSITPEHGKQKMDWSFAPNIAFALSLLVKKLDENPDSFGGKGYFINDDHPMGTADSEMYQTLIVGLGINPKPILTIPGGFLVKTAEAMEYLEAKLSALGIPFQPFLTVHEAMKAVVYHVASTENAKRDFGYYPLIPHDEAWEWTAKEFKERSMYRTK